MTKKKRDTFDLQKLCTDVLIRITEIQNDCERPYTLNTNK